MVVGVDNLTRNQYKGRKKNRGAAGLYSIAIVTKTIFPRDHDICHVFGQAQNQRRALVFSFPSDPDLGQGSGRDLEKQMQSTMLGFTKCTMQQQESSRQDLHINSEVYRVIHLIHSILQKGLHKK